MLPAPTDTPLTTSPVLPVTPFSTHPTTSSMTGPRERLPPSRDVHHCRQISTSHRRPTITPTSRYTPHFSSSYLLKCLHGPAPSCLANEFLRSSEPETEGVLRSTVSSSLIVRHTRLSTVGDRAVAAAACVWKELATSRLHRSCEFSAVV